MLSDLLQAASPVRRTTWTRDTTSSGCRAATAAPTRPSNLPRARDRRCYHQPCFTQMAELADSADKGQCMQAGRTLPFAVQAILHESPPRQMHRLRRHLQEERRPGGLLDEDADARVSEAFSVSGWTGCPSIRFSPRFREPRRGPAGEQSPRAATRSVNILCPSPSPRPTPEAWMLTEARAGGACCSRFPRQSCRDRQRDPERWRRRSRSAQEQCTPWTSV